MSHNRSASTDALNVFATRTTTFFNSLAQPLKRQATSHPASPSPSPNPDRRSTLPIMPKPNDNPQLLHRNTVKPPAIVTSSGEELSIDPSNFEFISSGSTSERGNINRKPGEEAAEVSEFDETPDQRFERTHPLAKVDWENKILQRRDKIVQELYETEKTYIVLLQKAPYVYLIPLQRHYNAQNNNITPNIAKLFATFTKIEFLLQLAKQLYKDLIARFEVWGENTMIGDVLIKFTPFLKSYSDYTEAYNDIVSCLREEKARDPLFAKLLERGMAHPWSKGLDIGAFLILPVQRIPRYVLLISDIIKNTSVDHPDYEPLTKSLSILKTVADHIDEAISSAENREKCLQIQNLFFNPFVLPGEQIKVLAPGRKFIYEGTLIKQCRKERKERRFFLFTDTLWYAFDNLGRYTLSGELPLTNLQVIDKEDAEDYKNAIEVRCSGKSFLVFAQTEEAKQMWLDLINNAIKSVKEKQGTLQVTTRVVENAPVWQPDDKAIICSKCKIAFTVLKRRHHCRNCGQVFCGDCTRYRMKVESVPGDACRVCVACFQKKYYENNERMNE